MENIQKQNEISSKEDLLKKSKEINPFLAKIRKDKHDCGCDGKYFITSTNFNLFYRVWHPKKITESSKVIICIHGMHSHGEKFVLLADNFEDLNWITISVDLRGHGLSWDKIEEIGDIDNFSLWVSDLEDFFKYIADKYEKLPIHIISESMGSVISVLIANKHPSQLKSLILLSPALKPWPLTQISMIEF